MLGVYLLGLVGGENTVVMMMGLTGVKRSK